MSTGFYFKVFKLECIHIECMSVIHVGGSGVSRSI